jgi:hypothetical protein
MQLYQPTITGSLSVSGSINISGSINVVGGGGTITGTASYATNAELLDGLDSTVFTLTSSFAAFTASQNILNGTYATTSSNTFTGIQTVNSNLIVTGSITAQTLVVQTITSSVDFVTGSTRFGSLSTNTHVFTGSMSISGSIGIGMTPSFPLDITSTSTGLLGRFASNQNEAQIRLTNTSAGGRSYSIGSGGNSSAGAKGFYIYDETSSATVFAISGSGNVGIGTSSPTLSNLQVNGSGNTTIGFFGASSMTTNQSAFFQVGKNQSADNNAGELSFKYVGDNDASNMVSLGFYGNGQKLNILKNGNVGIGTTTPSHSLHISLNSNTGSSVNHLFLFNPTGGTSQTAGIRLSTTSGWTIQLRTVENQDWLQIADSGGTVRQSWYGSRYYPGASSLNNSGAGYITGNSTQVGIGITPDRSTLLQIGDAGITNTNTYFGTGQVRIGGGSDHGANTVLSVAPGTINFDRPGVAGGSLTINSSGYILTPSQPAFYAYITSGTSTSTTGNFAGFTTTRLNRGSHYSTSTGRFTAPIAGVYRFVFAALYRRLAGSTAGEISISINGTNVNTRGMGYAMNNTTDAHTPVVVELIISLNASDYVMPFIYSVGSGSDWYVGENLAYFCGHLLG